MTKPLYFKVKIIRCCNPNYWYKNIIGKTIKVKYSHPCVGLHKTRHGSFSWCETRKGERISGNNLENVNVGARDEK